MDELSIIAVVDSSQIAEARRSALRLASSLDFTETAAGKLAIVVTETATNLLKHGGGGRVLLRPEANSGIEVLAVDSGPGMRNAAECVRDGFSTAGTAGTGLGAIGRMSSSSDIYTVPGCGTVVRAYCASGRERGTSPQRDWDNAALVSPLASETVSGDDIVFRQTSSSFEVLVTDGLGHGVFAAEAARAARDAFHGTRGTPREVMESVHAALRATRGAAVAAALVEPAANRVRFCGIGNISGLVTAGGNSQHMVSINGIAGHGAVRLREFEYSWTPESILVMHSDGLTSRWQWSTYPGLETRRASIIAAVLFRDCRKAADDASVLVSRRPV